MNEQGNVGISEQLEIVLGDETFYLVREQVVFENVYMIKADSAALAQRIVENPDNVPAFIQKHKGSKILNVTKTKHLSLDELKEKFPGYN